MNKGLRRFLILLAVFVAALAVFSRQMNHETKDMTTDMAAASLPVVYFERGGKAVNELHGYVSEMDAVSMRDTITPLEKDGILPLRVDTYGKKISGISYEVRSLDTTRLIQDSSLEVSGSDGTVQTQLQIQDLLEDGEEYLLAIRLAAGSDSYYYYTRIVRNEKAHVQECLDFVEKFHDITMDKERQDKLALYLEPSAEGDNTTLQKVTIHSSLSQTAWADFEGKEVTEPVASIKELNESYHVILLNYIMSSVGEGGASEYYNVEEYYRVRYGTEKMYLLDFERTMEEIFRSEGDSIRGDTINLGIRSGDVDFKANETGQIICFVQQGELWSYNLDGNRLSQVFSFRSAEGMDVRENYDEHDIRIVRTDEAGNIDFIVYGYMNRGDHEGQTGVSVCHYDGVTNMVEEQLFIPSDSSYQMLKEEMGRLMYISDKGTFYFMIGDSVHGIDLETKEDKVLISGLDRECYECSDSGRYLAWIETDQMQTMHLLDLETGSTYDVKAKKKQVIRPLGFMGTDCIYGTAKTADLSSGAPAASFAARQVVIMDAAGGSHEILKTYESKGTFVTGITIRDGAIYLDRVKKRGNGYAEADQETILNRDMQEKEVVYADQKESKKKQTVVYLQLSEQVPESSVKLLTSRQVIPAKPTRIELKGNIADYAYYVYAKGKILLVSNDVVKAVACADENGGVVTDKNQSYVWQRGRNGNPPGIAREEYPLDTELSKEALSGRFPDRTIYDLTGCTLEQVLYFVGEGYPVYAEESGRTVLLAGYDTLNVRIYHGSENSVSRRISAASKTFADSGNVFFCVGAEISGQE